MKSKSKIKLLFSLLSFAIVIFVIYSTLYKKTPKIKEDETLIHYINVGQGDCILIQNLQYNILIDGGSDTSKNVVIKYLKNNNIKTINYYIYSHPHEDHIGASDEIIENFTVLQVIGPKIYTNSKDFFDLIQCLKGNSLKITLLKNNSLITLNKNESLNILYNGEFNSPNINNNSMVIKYINNNIKFLFTGDIEKDIESFLLNKVDLSANVLKVSHHGSDTSTTKSFLQQVHPSIAIISCGMGNDYGHPNKNTLENLESINCKILRTDINGTIILKIKNSQINIIKEKADY